MSAAETLITDHLDTWCSATKAKSSAGRGVGKKQELYGVKKLRELILELAVCGLLIPQDPNDEPASELLRRITVEKTQRIKREELKKQKPLRLAANEIEFETPRGWEWTRLQEVSEYIQRGKGPRYSDDGSVRVVSQKCIQWSGFDLSAARFVANDSLEQYGSERYLRSNDLLWNSTGTGTAGRINRIDNIKENTIVADSHVTVVRSLSFNSTFLCYYISSPSIQKRVLPTHSESLVSGTTNQVELNTSAVTSLPIPLPPLAEQRRIVAKVDELMALCDQLEHQQDDSTRTHGALVQTLLGALSEASERGHFEKAWQRIESNFDTLFTTESSIDQLKQTILQLAVMGKLVEQNPEDEPAIEILRRIHSYKEDLLRRKLIKKPKDLIFEASRYESEKYPIGWWVGPFDEISTKITDGEHATPERQANGHFLLSARNVRDGFIDTSDVDYVGEDEFRRIRIRCNPDKNDILLSCSGSIGRVALVDEDAKYAMVRSAALIKIPSELLVPKFVMYVLQSPGLQGQIDDGSKKSAQANLFIEPIRRLSIPLPPLAEQHRIVAKVDELMALFDRLKASLQTAQATQLHLADSLVEAAIH